MKKNLLIIFILPLIFIACKENSSKNKSNEKLEFYSDNNNLTLKKRVKFEHYDSLYNFYRITDNPQFIGHCHIYIYIYISEVGGSEFAFRQAPP